MNRVKDKRLVVLTGIGIALCLGGFPLIILSRTVAGYPHNIVTTLGILMGMLGGGLIGGVLFFPLFNRRWSGTRGSENRLKKKAWKDFWQMCAITTAGSALFGFFTYANISGVQGAKYLIIGLAYAGLCVGIMVFRNNRKLKSHTAPEFDEREFSLIFRAVNIGNNLFIGYIFLFMMTAFYLVGGRGMVPMWSIPLVLYCGVFITGTVQFLILLHYIKEDQSDTEGEAA